MSTSTPALPPLVAPGLDVTAKPLKFDHVGYSAYLQKKALRAPVSVDAMMLTV